MIFGCLLVGIIAWHWRWLKLIDLMMLWQSLDKPVQFYRQELVYKTPLDRQTTDKQTDEWIQGNIVSFIY